MILNEYSKILEKEIVKIEELRKEIIIDEFVIMPNHLHLLIVIKKIIPVGCD
jgi:REP element-mobilizing transposase RayT